MPAYVGTSTGPLSAEHEFPTLLGAIGKPYFPGEVLRKTSGSGSVDLATEAVALSTASTLAPRLSSSGTGPVTHPVGESWMQVATESAASPWPGVPLGSPELPTFGSSGHHLRLCKPCAFVNTKGCKDGVNCKFCHLCGPGEKQRRKKEKHAFWRDLNESQSAWMYRCI
mmetsp:Transcript_64776/g.141112  ORF Transcript_64776/g.141112 Transcript_64776/m.141112 type:complete len:169 (+) Transcript_64776:66-572(+)